MRADEIPCAVFGPGPQPEAVLERTVRLVGGDHEILLDRGARDLPVGALLFVERPDIGDHETGGQHGLLDGVPDGVPGVVEDDGHPSSGLEHAAIRPKTPLHQTLIVGEALAFRAVDDSFRFAARENAVPGFNELVEVGVEYILPKGRIGEYVVD